MNKDTLIKEFNKEAIEDIKESKKLGYSPSRFIQMMSNYDNSPYKTALALSAKDITTGLERLAKLGRLDLTIEARIINPKYKELFSQELINICTKKLDKLGYPFH